MMRKLLVITAPLAVLGLTVLAVIVLQSTAPEAEKREPEERPLAAFVAATERQTIMPSIITQGDVSARIEIDLVPEISGRIVSIAPNFEEGGSFTRGQALIQIERADYELAVIRARAQVADAEQVLAREEAEAEMARLDWEDLGEGDPTDLTLRKPQLAQARAQLAAAEANLADAELDLERTALVAPFDGRVRQRFAGSGQFVTQGTQLGRIFSTETVQIRLPLTDRELGMLGLPIGYEAGPENGMKVDLSAVVAGTIRNWTGRIVRTNSAIDPTTRILYAVAEVSDPYGVNADEGVPLAVGLFVTAEIEGQPIEDVLVIPRAALRAASTVYVVGAENRLDIRQVSVTFSETDRAVIESGLEEGDLVVISALEGAVQGLKLEPLFEGESMPLTNNEDTSPAPATAAPTATQSGPSTQEPTEHSDQDDHGSEEAEL